MPCSKESATYCLSVPFIVHFSFFPIIFSIVAQYLCVLESSNFVYRIRTNKCMNEIKIKVLRFIFAFFLYFYAPNFEKVGDILVSACPYVCMYVCMYVRIHVRDIVLKLHVWIPHGKIADAYFWFSLNYLPLSNYGPLTNKGMKFCKCVSRKVL